MTREQANSELMQIYMSLSEEKKQALDVLMAQADGEYIKKSDMIDWLKDIRHKMKPQNYHTASEFEIAENQIWNLIQMLQMGAFPTVAIPSAEPCEDAISRSEAIKAIDEKAKRIKNADTLNGLAGAVGILFDLPSVKPQEPKTGWYIAHGMYEDRFWCSCGYIRIMDSRMNEWKFCPVCGGARMVETKESEEV